MWCETIILKIKLNLFELHSTGELVILKSINNLIILLQKTVNSLKLWNLSVEILLLSGELQIIEGNYQQAEEHLNQAQKIVKINQIPHLISKVSKERKKITNKIKKSQELIQNNASIVERLNSSDLHDYIERAKREFEMSKFGKI